MFGKSAIHCYQIPKTANESQTQAERQFWFFRSNFRRAVKCYRMPVCRHSITRRVKHRTHVGVAETCA